MKFLSGFISGVNHHIPNCLEQSSQTLLKTNLLNSYQVQGTSLNTKEKATFIVETKFILSVFKSCGH